MTAPSDGEEDARTNDTAAHATAAPTVATIFRTVGVSSGWAA
jgi:hypothetical protein